MLRCSGSVASIIATHTTSEEVVRAAGRSSRPTANVMHSENSPTNRKMSIATIKIAQTLPSISAAPASAESACCEKRCHISTTMSGPNANTMLGTISAQRSNVLATASSPM